MLIRTKKTSRVIRGDITRHAYRISENIKCIINARIAVFNPFNVHSHSSDIWLIDYTIHTHAHSTHTLYTYTHSTHTHTLHTHTIHIHTLYTYTHTSSCSMVSATSQHGVPPTAVPATLQKAFIRRDAHRTPFQRPYEGPFQVIECGSKTFKVAGLRPSQWTS